MVLEHVHGVGQIGNRLPRPLKLCNECRVLDLADDLYDFGLERRERHRPRHTYPSDALVCLRSRGELGRCAYSWVSSLNGALEIGWIKEEDIYGRNMHGRRSDQER